MEVKEFDEAEKRIAENDAESERRREDTQKCAEELTDFVKKELNEGNILTDTRWSSRYRYYGDTGKNTTIYLSPTRSGDNDKMIEYLERAGRLGVRHVSFGVADNFSLSASSYGGSISITAPKKEFMKFAIERNVTITNNERVKRIAELKDILDNGKAELETLHKEKNEEAKMKRELSKKRKVDATLSDEWFNNKK